ncbi:hypothetical protein [Saccharothrix obliqua]|uniref:hypothetical protein n=1 Tax=Saccharothrix obliqua TaxID=2861747 RepID=UPI001C5EBF1E|nr:hypothetical protein [Saccharothrix obliqua]MBW4719396.1 hypothetical protein [Saccharothrix obliqua]
MITDGLFSGVDPLTFGYEDLHPSGPGGVRTVRPGPRRYTNTQAVQVPSSDEPLFREDFTRVAALANRRVV